MSISIAGQMQQPPQDFRRLWHQALRGSTSRMPHIPNREGAPITNSHQPLSSNRKPQKCFELGIRLRGNAQCECQATMAKIANSPEQRFRTITQRLIEAVAGMQNKS